MSTPTARDLMTDRVYAARADWSLQRLASFFTEHAISGAPVVSEYGSAIGVVSLTDIARHDSKAASASEERPPAYFLGDAELHEEEPSLDPLQDRPQASVRDIMMPAVFTIEADAPIQEVADRMVRGRLHRLLVVRPGTKRDIVGIVSAIDVLEWVRDRALPAE
jgi:CBS domain-containing protein